MVETLRSLAAALGLLGLLTGCSGGVIGDALPSGMGGLPSAAPARPAAPAKFPAVHDMPPPRSTSPMSEAEHFKLEKELEAARDRQAGAGEAAPPAPAATKKKPPPGR